MDRIKDWANKEEFNYSDGKIENILRLGTDSFLWAVPKGADEVSCLYCDDIQMQREGFSLEMRALVKACCLLLKGANYERWSGLDFREVENFLRIENHLAVFSEEILEKEAKNLLKKIKSSLFFLYLHENFLKESIYPKQWKSSLIENVRSVRDLFERLKKPLEKLSIGQWKPINVYDKTIELRRSGDKKAQNDEVNEWFIEGLNYFMQYAFLGERLILLPT